jgi:hypothetical protein
MFQRSVLPPSTRRYDPEHSHLRVSEILHVSLVFMPVCCREKQLLVPNVRCRVHNSPTTNPVLSQQNPATPSYHLFKMHIFLLSERVKVPYSLKIFPTKLLYQFLISPSLVHISPISSLLVSRHQIQIFPSVLTFKKPTHVTFQAVTATSMKMAVFWNAAPCSLVDAERRFRGLLPSSP